MVDIKPIKVSCTVCGHSWIPRKTTVDKCSRCQKKGVLQIVAEMAQEEYNKTIEKHHNPGE